MHAWMHARVCLLVCLAAAQVESDPLTHAQRGASAANKMHQVLLPLTHNNRTLPAESTDGGLPAEEWRLWNCKQHTTRAGRGGGVPADPDPPQSSLSPRPSAPPALRISALSPQDLVLCRCRPPQREWWGSFPGIAAIARDKREGVPLILSQPQPQPQLRRAPSSMRVAGLEPTVFLWPFWPLAFGLGPEIAAPNQLSHSLCLHSAHFLPQADRRVGVCLLLVGGGRQAAISRSAGCKVFWQYGVNRPGTAGSRGRRSNQ